MLDILIVEDDKNTRKLLSAILGKKGYNVLTASNGLEALDVLDNHHVDLMVVDVMMPQMDGYELTKELRENDSNIPILMLTAKQSKEDVHQGFLVGIDDYMTKPFDEQEFLLRINALLRRSQIVTEHKLVIGDFELNYDTFTATYKGEEEILPQKEFLLLYKLLSYPNKIFTRYQLMDEIWGVDTETDEHTLNVHINRLRTRYGNCPEFEILTLRGLGYKAVKKNEKR